MAMPPRPSSAAPQIPAVPTPQPVAQPPAQEPVQAQPVSQPVQQSEPQAPVQATETQSAASVVQPQPVAASGSMLSWQMQLVLLVLVISVIIGFMIKRRNAMPKDTEEVTQKEPAKLEDPEAQPKNQDTS